MVSTTLLCVSGGSTLLRLLPGRSCLTSTRSTVALSLRLQSVLGRPSVTSAASRIAGAGATVRHSVIRVVLMCADGQVFGVDAGRIVTDDVAHKHSIGYRANPCSMRNSVRAIRPAFDGDLSVPGLLAVRAPLPAPRLRHVPPVFNEARGQLLVDSRGWCIHCSFASWACKRYPEPKRMAPGYLVVFQLRAPAPSRLARRAGALSFSRSDGGRSPACRSRGRSARRAPQCRPDPLR